jgi:hypothetical protein
MKTKEEEIENEIRKRIIQLCRVQRVATGTLADILLIINEEFKKHI